MLCLLDYHVIVSLRTNRILMFRISDHSIRIGSHLFSQLINLTERPEFRLLWMAIRKRVTDRGCLKPVGFDG